MLWYYFIQSTTRKIRKFTSFWYFHSTDCFFEAMDGSISSSNNADQYDLLALWLVQSFSSFWWPFVQFFCFDHFLLQMTFYSWLNPTPIDESDHLKVASYWLEYGVYDEVVGCTLVMYFHTAMVNIKSNILVVFASYLYRELFI